MNVIETKKLTKYYLGRKVLGIKNLDLEVKEGEIFGFIGPNGAGKSTTIRLLLDLIRPTSGDAKIFGKDVNKLTVSIKEEVGYLPGEIFLDDGITGEECLNYYKGFKKNIDHKYLNSLINRFDFSVDKKVRDYSKGNRQKLAIILALMHKPKLLILDEPTSGLDPLNQQEFFKVLKETQKTGTTTFLSTHILDEANRICDRVGIIKSGELISIENIDDFRKKNIRDIDITTSTTIPLSHFKIDGITKVARTTSGYHLSVAGPVTKILEEILKHDISDIDITKPTLEEIFIRFYR
ncbi:MAG: ABC transporter ATP-binding protein [Candidatus Berkelbacteria bacterium]